MSLAVRTNGYLQCPSFQCPDEPATIWPHPSIPQKLLGSVIRIQKRIS